MSRSILLPLSLSLVLAGCFSSKKDSDEDGITDKDEEDLGTDPESSDSDGDGLEDGEELDLGTDPLSVDSDEDTYQDGWEVDQGTDPTDYDSRIYTGFWPYNPDKDSLEVGDWSDFEGDADQFLPRTVLMDQFGDMVDMHDFSQQGVPVMIDVSAMWCGPCQGLAKWLSTDRDPYGFGDYWPHVKEALEAGELRWITVLSENNSGRTPDLEELQEWYDDYEDPNVPILGDEDGDFRGIIAAYPSMFFFDENMQLMQGPTNQNHYQPMDDAESMFSE